MASACLAVFGLYIAAYMGLLPALATIDRQLIRDMFSRTVHELPAASFGQQGRIKTEPGDSFYGNNHLPLNMDETSTEEQFSSVRPGLISFAAYKREIPDINTWKQVSRGNQKIRLDPRIREDFLNAPIDWSAPFPATQAEDPLGIFRNNRQLDMDNHILTKYLREVVLISPSEEEYSLNAYDVKDPSEDLGTSEVIFPLLVDVMGPNAKAGIFFEAGALDGETNSKTLFLERQRGWTGLNVEMTWPNVNRYQTKSRKCWFAPICLSPKPWPMKRIIAFEYDPNDPLVETRTASFMTSNGTGLKGEHLVYAVVDCFPLYSLLHAANMTRVDFFNLDLQDEATALEVLRTLPFESLELSVIVVRIDKASLSASSNSDQPGNSTVNAIKDLLAVENGFVQYNSSSLLMTSRNNKKLEEHEATYFARNLVFYRKHQTRKGRMKVPAKHAG